MSVYEPDAAERAIIAANGGGYTSTGTYVPPQGVTPQSGWNELAIPTAGMQPQVQQAVQQPVQANVPVAPSVMPPPAAPPPPAPPPPAPAYDPTNPHLGMSLSDARALAAQRGQMMAQQPSQPPGPYATAPGFPTPGQGGRGGPNVPPQWTGQWNGSFLQTLMQRLQDGLTEEERKQRLGGVFFSPRSLSALSGGSATATGLPPSTPTGGGGLGGQGSGGFYGFLGGLLGGRR
jgi:hypothetical protein